MGGAGLGGGRAAVGTGAECGPAGGYGAGARPRRPAAAMGSMSPALPKVLVFFLFFERTEKLEFYVNISHFKSLFGPHEHMCRTDLACRP